MSYTHPFGQPQGTAKMATNFLREAMIGEIIAINGYQEHIANSNMAEINAAWQSIMDDEKKHYGMFMKLLRKYDPVELKMYQMHNSARAGMRAPLQPFRPNFDRQIILNNVRMDIKGELEAVILYENEIDNVTQRDIRETLQAVADEEKGHTEHLTALLLKYDPDQYNGIS